MLEKHVVLGSPHGRNHMGYMTLAVSGSPSGEKPNEVHNPCRLEVRKCGEIERET